MSSSNCCFLTCIQVSQEAGQVVWYSHLLQNFPQFIVIHTVEDFGVVNKAEINVFFWNSLAFSKSQVNGNIRKNVKQGLYQTGMRVTMFLKVDCKVRVVYLKRTRVDFACDTVTSYHRFSSWNYSWPGPDLHQGVYSWPKAFISSFSSFPSTGKKNGIIQKACQFPHDKEFL